MKILYSLASYAGLLQISDEVPGKHQSPAEKMKTSVCGLGGLTNVC